MNKQTITDIDVRQKRVLVRVDFNVPFVKGTTTVSDDSRIQATLPTIRHLMERGAMTILCSHLGRPQGRVVEEMRLAPVVERTSQLLGIPVAYARDCIGPPAEEAVRALPPGRVLILENLRFHPEEEKNDPVFAQALASLADVYVNDAFGTAHRAHASTAGVTQYLPAVCGFLMQQELEMLGRIVESPARPCAALIGGAKVSSKIAVLDSLLERVDTLIVGGGMAATFLKARGLEVGDSLVEEQQVEFAGSLIGRARERGLSLVLPSDVIIADSFDAAAHYRVADVAQIPSGWYIMDIGPDTVSMFERELRRCKTVVWNGPMGVFEWQAFSEGTKGIAQVLAALEETTTVIGGGSTAEAVVFLGLADKMTHVSTGGGASLELLEGKVLPGVAALMDKPQ